MIDRLRRLLDQHMDRPPAECDAAEAEHRLAVAATALMLQVAQVDKQEDQREIDLILDLAGKVHDLTTDEQQDLLALAREKALDATSMYEFTRVVNDRCTHRERIELVVLLWLVAFADDQIHKYEEHLIRRVADLLYLTPAEFIQCRHMAQERRKPTA